VIIIALGCRRASAYRRWQEFELASLAPTLPLEEANADYSEYPATNGLSHNLSDEMVYARRIEEPILQIHTDSEYC
jgi:hypothetical protein